MLGGVRERLHTSMREGSSYISLNWEFININVCICTISEQKLKRVREYFVYTTTIYSCQSQNKN